MADVIIKILGSPAASYALLSLEELKEMLVIGGEDTSSDGQLQQMIDWYSSSISITTNRVFARERVQETWRYLGSGRRLFLSHWPVVESDIESVESPRGTLLANTEWELEERSGKLMLLGSVAEPIVVIYTGGYILPGQAPDALKNAAAILVRQGRAEAQREATAGLRSVSHKDSRVMFFDPNLASRGTANTGGSDATRAVNALLSHFTRLEV